jgi:hypothetical protein
LYEAQKRHAPGQLGDNATKEFVLRHVFEIAPELIKQPSDLLRALLRRHYRGQRIPTVLDDRFVQLLLKKNIFDDWPLETLVFDREAFFAFLQERWPIFLDLAEKNEHAKSLQAQVDNAFAAWVFKRYAGLVNLPPVPPVMLHHLPRFLARQVGEDRNAKIGLIVVDGLAMDQWLVVRGALASRQAGFRFREQAVEHSICLST